LALCLDFEEKSPLFGEFFGESLHFEPVREGTQGKKHKNKESPEGSGLSFVLSIEYSLAR